MVHWAVAVPFIVCYTTALILFFVYNPAPSRPFRAVFSWTHRISGACLILLPLLVFLRGRNELRVHIDNIKRAWRWTFDDVRWLILKGVAVLRPDVQLPEEGKFNAGEKLNFMMVMTTYPLFVVTGILIWLPDVAFYSWLLHLALAAVALPLVLGHIYMALINPDTRIGLPGMITGFVDRAWAAHHYRRWFRDNFEPQPEIEHVIPVPRVALPAIQPPVPRPSPRRSPGESLSLQHPVRIRCQSCDAEQTLDTWTRLLHAVCEGDRLLCPRCGRELNLVSAAVDPRMTEQILEHLGRDLTRAADWTS